MNRKKKLNSGETGPRGFAQGGGSEARMAALFAEVHRDLEKREQQRGHPVAEETAPDRSLKTSAEPPAAPEPQIEKTAAEATVAEFIIRHVGSARGAYRVLKDELPRGNMGGILAGVRHLPSLSQFLEDALSHGIPVRLIEDAYVPGGRDDFATLRRMYNSPGMDQFLEKVRDQELQNISKSRNGDGILKGLIINQGGFSNLDEACFGLSIHAPYKQFRTRNEMEALKTAGRFITHYDPQHPVIVRFLEAWSELSDRQKEKALKPWVEFHRMAEAYRRTVYNAQPQNSESASPEAPGPA